ncbi:hypothetical protein [Nitrosomonas sp. Nm84]|uniref:hypothetical protein n=1 Tax=Nitrosomonas sp. Nm84 TaxID=200124 RepID=UPI00105319E5|nr:hypothetical protein [Nitrosomonas sp. Nm84]
MMLYIKNRFASITALLVIITLGLIQSPTVLGGDQSLFVVIAQLLDSGKTLYKDLFDYKQPGIYLFYLIAGKTFGWSDVGIHIFELGYWIVFSLFLIFSIRKYSLFRADYFNSLLPLFIIGVYYCNANFLHLTQLEALINFPLFLIVWLLDRAYKTENGLFVTYLAIGALIGIVLLCKLVFSPIIFSFLLIHFIFFLKRKSLGYIFIKQIVPLILGFAIPVSIFLFYVFIHHIENLVLDIYFKIPTSVIGLEDQIDLERLFSSIRWYGKKMIVFLALAVIGVFLISKKESHFLSLILSWAIVGLFVILMQKTSWWAYHFQLLYVPIGLFAAMGLDFIFYHSLLRIKPKAPLLEGCLIAVVLSLVFYNQLNAVWKGLASHNYTKLYSYDYAKDDVTNLLKVLKKEDTIFVCGNPRMYVLASRLPELSINGWILEYYLDYQWEEFYSEFKDNSPTYLFVKNDYDRLIASKNKKLWELITNEYSEYDSVENGKWYKKI